jgi:hypothetical protein
MSKSNTKSVAEACNSLILCRVSAECRDGRHSGVRLAPARWIWKSELPRSVRPEQNEWVTSYVKVSFGLFNRGFVPGHDVECPDALLATKRAELMLQETEIIGSVAFARRGNPDNGEFDVATVLKICGNLPEGLRHWVIRRDLTLESCLTCQPVPPSAPIPPAQQYR